jgi:hypothetical protein
MQTTPVIESKGSFVMKFFRNFRGRARRQQARRAIMNGNMNGCSVQIWQKTDLRFWYFVEMPDVNWRYRVTGTTDTMERAVEIVRKETEAYA